MASGASDADGDNIRYLFTWEVTPEGGVAVAGLPPAPPVIGDDGTLVAAAAADYDTISEWIAPPYDTPAESVIPAGIAQKGDTWTVTVLVEDEDNMLSAPVTAQVVVAGVPPAPAAVVIEVIH